MSNLKKRYQVFVSSTYEDLKEERQEIIQALLELNCIPAGMELFPAADESQWSVIKAVIDDCDYYIVIIAGRYGSEDHEGMSYTEKEYRYALERNKPIIAFLHEKPDYLPVIKTDKNEEKRRKLDEFKKLVSNKMFKYWINSQHLGAVVSRGLTNLINQHPAIGWIRADQLPSEDITAELLKLRMRIEELEIDLETERKQPPKDSERYAQGDQYILINYSFSARDPMEFYNISHNSEIYLTWNEIFSHISPSMLDENTEYNLKNRLNSYIMEKTSKQKSQDYKYPQNFIISEESFELIIVQFNALRLIEKSRNKHTASDTSKYWSLSEFGERTMTRLRAIKNVDFFEGDLSDKECEAIIEFQRAINDSIMELLELNYSDNGYVGKEHVKELSLSSKDLSYIPKSIKDLEFLETLQIHNSNLETIPKSIGELFNLKILDLEDNELKSIPENIGELKNLKELNLCMNEINKIPDSIGELVNLERLDIMFNPIEYLPKNFEKLMSLKDLSISFGNIDKFQSSISTLMTLRTLSIEGGVFTQIPESLFNLIYLEELWINCNEILSISGLIKNLENLTNLTIACKNLSELPLEIGELTKLKYLDVSECSLSTLPESILNLINLETLRIEDNRIKPLSDQIESVLTKLEQNGCKILKAITEEEGV